MKSIINNTADYAMEMVRRTLYTLQVLILVLAVPVLFMTGITNRGHKSASQNNTTEVRNDAQLSEKPMTDFTIIKI